MYRSDQNIRHFSLMWGKREVNTWRWKAIWCRWGVTTGFRESFPSSILFSGVCFERYIQTGCAGDPSRSLQTVSSSGAFLVLFLLCYGLIFVGFKFDFKICLNYYLTTNMLDNLRFYNIARRYCLKF